jgi:hypothetical protein
VLIARQYAYRGAELVVIPQPDGSVACIPAWMTHESAAHHQPRAEPRLPLDILRSLRAEIDTLLGFLQSDSGVENTNNEAQERKYLANNNLHTQNAVVHGIVDSGGARIVLQRVARISSQAREAHSDGKHGCDICHRLSAAEIAMHLTFINCPGAERLQAKVLAAVDAVDRAQP